MDRKLRKMRTAMHIVSLSSTMPDEKSWSFRSRIGKKMKERSRASIVAIDANDMERLEKMIQLARTQLERFAAAESAAATKAQLEFIGGTDGAGMLVRLARLDVDGDGRISAHEYELFMTETQQLFDGMKSSVLNQSVVAALLLAASAPFLLGPFEVFFPTAWEGDASTATADLMGIGGSTSAWGDAAAFFQPSRPEAAARIRRIFFAIEVLLLSTSLFSAALSLKTAKSGHRAARTTSRVLCHHCGTEVTTGSLMRMSARIVCAASCTQVGLSRVDLDARHDSHALLSPQGTCVCVWHWACITAFEPPGRRTETSTDLK